MSIDITPGSLVTVTVVRQPTSQRAGKTLSRIFARDPVNQREARRRNRIRTQVADPHRRGGRIWMNKTKAPPIVQPGKGDACRIRATVDVIADLGSVSRFVEVTTA